MARASTAALLLILAGCFGSSQAALGAGRRLTQVPGTDCASSSSRETSGCGYRAELELYLASCSAPPSAYCHSAEQLEEPTQKQ